MDVYVLMREPYQENSILLGVYSDLNTARQQRPNLKWEPHGWGMWQAMEDNWEVWSITEVDLDGKALTDTGDTP